MRRDPYDHLFVPSVPALRRKLKNSTGTLASMWRNIQAVPTAGGNGRFFAAFCHLATGKDEWAEMALHAIDEDLEKYLAGDLSLDIHFHTWCNAAPMARTAAAFDWIADSRAVSPKDRRRISEAMIDYCFKHPFNIAKSRTLAFDNQIGAMSFACTLIGYLFGVRRGRDARAQRMMAAGLMRFPDLVALSPRGGYSFEGSTYFCQIVAPMTTLYSALVEQITGEDVFDRRWLDTGTTVREILDLYSKLVGPSGLMPPWDHYGWMRCMSVMPMTYLASKTGDPRPIEVIESLELADEPAMIPWGADDKMWAAIWWPEREVQSSKFKVQKGAKASRRSSILNFELCTLNSPFTPWALSTIGGALVASDKPWRLFQAWDRSSHGIYVGRAQVNPNLITLDLWGSIFFTDGVPDHDLCRYFDFPPELFNDVLRPGELDAYAAYMRTFNPKFSLPKFVQGFSYGTIAGSNSIVINGEKHYTPANDSEGRLVAFASLPNLQLVAAEVAPYYQPRYPIASMIRTSVLAHDDYFIVCDTIKTDGPSLSFGWQAFTSGKVTAEGADLTIETPERVSLNVIPLFDGAKPTLTDVPGYPRFPGLGSTLIEYHAQGAEVSIPLLLAPRRGVTPVADLSDGWRIAAVDHERGEKLGLPGGVAGGKTMRIDDAALAGARNRGDAWVWSGRSFRVPGTAKGRRVFLHLPSTVEGLCVWVNGQPVRARPQASTQHLNDNMLPLVIDVTDALRRGDNALVLAGESIQGKLVNRGVELMIEAPAANPINARPLGDGRFEITGDWGRDELLLNPTGRVVATEDYETDARTLLVQGKAAFAALRVTRLRFGLFEFISDRPLDVSFADGRVTLGDLSGPERFELSGDGWRLGVQSRGVIDIDLSGAQRPTFTAALDNARPVFCNGTLIDAGWSEPVRRIVVTPRDSLRVGRADPAAPPYVKRMTRLATLAGKGDAAAVKALIKALDDVDWKVQQFAAELLGRIGARAATGPLLALLARESAEVIYSTPTVWWSEAITSYKEKGAAWLAGRGSSADGAKRHRVKTAVIEALGRLRAKQAVPALSAILGDDREFYPVHSLAAQALGRIGDAAALPALEKMAQAPEVNTKYRVQDAIHRIKTGGPKNPAWPDRAEH